MGLFLGLLTLPLAPVRGVAWVGEQVQTLAEQEYTGPGAVSRQLADIETAWAAGEITDEHREELEQQVLDELLWTDNEG